jgi:hypothetical protein
MYSSSGKEQVYNINRGCACVYILLLSDTDMHTTLIQDLCPESRQPGLDPGFEKGGGQ